MSKQLRFERRKAERACAKHGHVFPLKTIEGKWYKLPCKRCGIAPPEDTEQYLTG